MNPGRIEDLGLRPLQPGKVGAGDGPNAPQGTPGTEGPSFGEALEQALRDVDNHLEHGDRVAAAYVAGDPGVDLHSAMIEMQSADVSFRAMVQVRNKLVDAYKEIMRLQV
jgi:flagellar hook-basal body complex protein FliE